MAELKDMTVRALRELARKHVGAGYRKLKTKSELIAALAKVLPAALREPGGEHADAPRPGEKPAPASAAGAKEGEDSERARPTKPTPKPPERAARIPAPGPAAPPAAPPAPKKIEPVAPPSPPPSPTPRPPMEEQPPPSYMDEALGDLPESYGEDSVVLLPKDARSLYLYWDFSVGTLERAFEWMPGLRTRLRLYADGQPIRDEECSLGSRSWYFRDLPGGRSYRAELLSVAIDGQVRRIGPASNSVRLPAGGPARVIDDRFIRIPLDLSPSRLVEALQQVGDARRAAPSPPPPSPAPPSPAPPATQPVVQVTAGLPASDVARAAEAARREAAAPGRPAPLPVHEGPRLGAADAPARPGWPASRFVSAADAPFDEQLRERLYRASGGGQTPGPEEAGSSSDLRPQQAEPAAAARPRNPDDFGPENGREGS